MILRPGKNADARALVKFWIMKLGKMDSGPSRNSFRLAVVNRWRRWDSSSQPERSAVQLEVPTGTASATE